MNDLLVDKELDFEVGIQPVTVFNPETGLYVDSSKYKAIMRPDNGHIYGICTKRQALLQNQQLVELLVKYYGEDKVRQSRFIKSDRNASRLSVMINNGNKFSGSSMEMESWFTIKTSFDQSEALNFGITDQILVCTNGLTRNEYKKQFSFRHTENMEKMLDDYSTLVTAFNSVYEEHYGFYETLKERKINKATAFQFIDDLFGVDFSKPDVEEVTPTRTYNIGEAVKHEISQSFREQGGNMFALLQGVTRYTSHKVAAKTDEDRRMGLLFGNGYRINNQAYEYLQDALN